MKTVGIYCVDTDGGGGAERRSVVMARSLSRRYSVILILGQQQSLSDLERYHGIDLAGVRLYQLKLPIQRAAWRFVQSPAGACLRFARADSMLRNLRRDLDPFYYRELRNLGLDLFINNTFGSNIRNPGRRGVFMCMFPHPMQGQPYPWFGLTHSLYRSAVRRFSALTPEILNTWDVVTANSKFTAGWIERMWNRRAEIVYSAAPDMGPAGTKRNMILHVGRFLSEVRTDYKHQGTLLEVFRKMTDLRDRNWELHLAGSVMRERSSRRMLARLGEAARGLPVHIHAGIGFERLRSLYRDAAIYWHATGYGTSADLQPLAQEHFGITTVEAMSAGAVPVVIDAGGQTETVNHGVNGFRWRSLDQLSEYTRLLAGDRALWESLSRQAVAGSAMFSAEAFAQRIARIAASLLEGEEPV
jgi:glycosyltransferase involved in cell wall biosynthesis